MKKKILKNFVSPFTNLSFILLLIFSNCSTEINEKDYLNLVSKNLDQIKSANFFSTKVSSAPEDTAKFTEPKTYFYRIYQNPSDTLVGSASATYMGNDTTKMTDFYDGAVRGKCYWDKQYVKVDSFQNHPYPFRLVYYPFYYRINEILKYTLTTNDSIKTTFTDCGDSIHFCLKIINKHVYFHIKPIVIKNQFIPDDEISQFDIWFKKADNLPYRMRSKWHHTTLYEYCYDAEFNTTKDITFHAADYYPSTFEIKQFKREEKTNQVNMVGQKAPDWTLLDTKSNSVKFSDLRSKVLLIQFTGVGCGPCHQAIPFLKELVEKYKDESFEFISLETWSNNMEGLIRYQNKNEFNYRFLKSNDEVTKAYGVSAVPAFFILDENRVIQKMIRGYSTGETDKEIIENIEKLL